MKIGPGFKASMKRRSVRIALALAVLSCIASFAVARRIAAFQTPTGVTYTVYRFDFDGHDVNPGDGVCQAKYQTGQYVCGFIPFGVAYCPTFESGCTLRAAVEEANAHPGADTINFASEYGYASGLGCRTMFASCTVPINDDKTDVNGQTGTGNIPITDALTINGLGAQRLIFDGGGSQRSRIFSIGSVPVTINGITLQGGNGSGGDGGAIYAGFGSLTLDAVHITGNFTESQHAGGGLFFDGGTHQIRNSTLFDNTAGTSGGALASKGQLTITNSTITGNNANQGGGGLYNSSSMTLRNSTISGNTAGGATAVGGGVDNKGTLDVGSTIIAGNNAASMPEMRVDNPDSVTSAGYNLIGDSSGDATNTGYPITYQLTDIRDFNPKLGALQNNGGPTLTRALAEDSPAYDKGNSFGLAADQRGFLRTIDNPLITNPLLGDGTDIGAYEIGGLVVNSLGDEADADPGNGACEIATGNSVCTLRAAIEELNASPLGSYKIFFALPGTGMRTIELFTALPAISRSVTITGLGAGLLTVKRSSDPATPPFRIFKFQNRNGAEPAYATVSGMTISNGLATLEDSAAATGGGISNNATELTLDGVHVTGNHGTSNGGSGAGIFNSSTLTIRNSTISNNVGQKLDPSSPYTFDGGGIYSITDNSCDCKTFTMINSTVSGNSVDGGAGGIFTFGPATITNSTIVFNSAGSGAGGIVNQSSSSGSQRVTLGNTIVSDNRYNGGSVGDIYSTRDVISQGYNLVQYPVSPTLGQCGGSGPSNWCGTDLLGIDPNLLPLADNGGPTPTHSFPQSSPAVDKGNSFGQTADQRGVQRPLDFPSITNSTNGDGSDIGAYESGGEPFVFSMNRMDVNPNGINTTVRFNVTFSEDVTEVNSNDFTLTTTGAISGATITGVTGSGTIWTVSINTGTVPGGTIRLDFVPHGTVIDADKNPITKPFAGVFYDIQPEFDVTAPGDPVRLVNGTSDDNVSPPLAGKGPDKAIDDTTTPYYNDYDNGSGLIVAPARGATIVTALRIYPGLQSKDSDPASYKLEGSNDGGVTFTTISEGTLALPDQRNPEGKKLDAPNLVSQTVTFSNSSVFTSYRLTFPTLKASQNTDYMVVGEVEFIGSDAVAADLSLTMSGGTVDFDVTTSTPPDTITRVDGYNFPGNTNGGGSPFGQDIDKAIDNTTTKYLNFLDLNSGFTVTPARGATVVTGLRLYTADDAPECDPASYKLEGSNDGVNFTIVSQGLLALPDGRNGAGQAISTPGLFSQTVSFSNSTAYTRYRLIFPTLKNQATANSMQIGEAELIGYDRIASNPGGKISYQITLTNNGPDAAANVTLSDAIPANTTFDSFTQNSGPTFAAATPAIGGSGNISATTATLASGESAVFTLVVRVNDSVVNDTVITNTASATTSTTELNSSNSSVTTNALITCPPITLSPTTLPAGDTSTAYSQTISASGGLGNYTFSLSSGSLPDGLTLAINGVISGSPTKTGAFNFTVKAMDGANSCPGMRSYSIQIDCGTITIPAATLPNGTTSAAYPNQTITASGGTASYTYSVSTGSLPNGLSLSTVGTISGTPTAAGTYSFAVKAADANGCSATQSYTIAIDCAAITISPSLFPDGTLNLVYLQTQVSASGGTGSYGFAVTGLPNGLSFTQTTSSVTIKGTPTQSGTFTVSVTATDGNNCPVTKIYALTIGCEMNPVVTSTNDAGAGSLRRAITTKCDASNPITFDIPTDGSDAGYDSATEIFTLKLSTAGDGTYGPSALSITRDVTIDGGTKRITITRDPSVNMRLFYIASSGKLTLRNLTLRNGYARGGDGGSSNQGGGGGGAAGLGGAIYNAGILAIYGSTLTDNQSIGGSGGSNSGSGILGGGGGGGLGGNGNNAQLEPDRINGADGGGPNAGGPGFHSSVLSDWDGRNGGIGGGGGGGASGARGGSSAFGGGGGGGGANSGRGGNGGFGGGNGGDYNSSSSTQPRQSGHGGSGFGGAIFNDIAGVITVVNSTLTGNNAQGGTGATSGKGQGGAIFNRGGTVTATNTTIAANTADQGGGGIYNLGDGTASATLTLANSIVAGTANGATDIQKSILNGGTSTVSGLFTLIGKTDPSTGFIDGTDNNQVGTVTALDPKLDTLKYNGGVTQTLALLAGSPALDKGNNTAQDSNGNPINTDQRGLPRDVDWSTAPNGTGDISDIGAYEAQIGAPHHVLITQQPTGTTAGSPLSIAVQIVDASDNLTGSNANVTIVLGANPGNSTLSGTLTVAAVNSTATFSGISLDKAGTGYTLVANSVGLTGATSNAFDITAGAPGKLLLVQQPTDTLAGQPITPAVTVQLTDPYDNPVAGSNVDISIATNPASATLSGTTSSTTDANGVATFGDLSINKAADGYTLKASKGNLTATSNTLNIIPTCYDSRIVTNTADSGADSLRQAMKDVCDDGTITFNIPTSDAGYDATTKRHTIVLTSGQLAIDKGMTIDGAGANSIVIDGNRRDRVFNIDGNLTVTLSGLEIRNGSNQNGGGISNRGTLTLNHCMLSGNSARSGGGIDNSGTLTLNVCTLSGNSAGSGGGILSRGTLTLNHCTLSGNSATSDWGGGIYNIGKLTLNASTLSTNSAHRGGGVYNISDGAESSLTVINSTLNGNSASDLGGGIYNNVRSGDAIAYVINSTFNNNSAGSEGGGIYNIAFTIATKITVINCTFNGNSAVDGGGIYNRAGSVSAQVKIGNTILRAGSKGRNLYNYSGTITSNGYNLSTDFAEGYLNNTGDRVNSDPKLDPAGLKDNGGPTITIRPLFGSPAIDAGKNMATDANGNAITTDQRGSARPVDFTGIANAEGGDGSDIGAFEAQIGTTPNRLEFVQLSTKSEVNSAITPPVRVVIFDAENNQTASNATITIALAASGNSGALQGTTTVTAVDGVATFPDLLIDKPGTGYALVASSANLTGATSNAFDVVPGPVSKVTFVQQPTDTVAGQPITPAVKVQVLDAFDNPISNAFFQLTGLINGVSGGSASTSTDTLGIATYSNFVLNKPGTYKLLAYNGSVGALSSVFNVRQSCTNPEVISTADSGPGSLRQAITDTCEGSTITFNIPTTDPGYDVTTKRHIITLTGGELAINKDLRIDGIGGNSVVISGNNQSRVFNIARSQTVSITGLTISNGNATNSGSNTNGGAIFNSGALTLINSTLNSNSAELGGGIYNNGVSGDASVAIINCTLSDNSATSRGGGVNTVSSFGYVKVTVANSTLSGNSAPQGGGIYNRVVTRGSAIVTLSNTILRTGSSGENIVNVPGENSSTYVITSNGYNLSNDNGGGFLTGTGDQVSTDPGFEMDSSTPAKPLMRDNGGPVFTIRLLPNSPAINKGSNALAVDQNNNTLATDARGFPRIVNSTVDIGALEVNYQLNATGGTPQSTPINTTFGTPLQATFTESNRLVNNASVTFTAPTNGATGTFANSSSASVTVSTEANGIATAPAFTANSITGDYNVTGGVTGFEGTTNYALTNRTSSQSITFPNPGSRTFGDAPFAFTASASSGLPVSYTIISGPASVNGNMLTITGAGTVTVRASQAGNASFDPAQNVDQTFTVNKAIGTLALSNLSQIYDGSAKAATVITNPSNLSGVTVTYSQNGNVIQTPTSVGSYAVTASLNNNNYHAVDATGVLVIAKADQSISFAALSTRTYGDKPFSISATASSGLPVSFSIVSGPASISGNTVTISGAGTVTVRASQPGDTSYNPAQSVDQTFSVDKSAASITLSNLSQTYDGNAKAALVTTNPLNLGGVTITYSQNGTSIQSPVAAGSYNVIASLGNNNYQANDATGTLVIAKADQTIAFAPLPNKSYGDVPFNISATASSGLPVSFSIVSGPASISGNTVTITGAGTVTVRASQAGDNNYNAAASVDRSFTVSQFATTILVTSSLNPAGYGESVTFNASVTSSATGKPTGTVQFKDNGGNIGGPVPLNNSGVASVTTSTLSPGTHTITVVYSGDQNFGAGTGTLANGQTINAQVGLSISDASVTEGNSGTTNAVFNITLSPASSQTVTVNYQTADGTAKVSDNDYKATSGTVTFSPGETTKTVTVLVNGDTGYEPDETFFVNLSNPGNASIARAQGVGTIINEDLQSGTIQFAASTYSVNEGDGQLVIMVTRTGDLSGGVNVDYVTSGITASDRSDYNTAIGTLVFKAGEISKQINVLINEDSYLEGPEVLSLRLSNPTNGSVIGTPEIANITIVDNDTQPPTSNIIDDAQNFVRQQYHDFLDREPDAEGLAYWTNEITKCGNDQECIKNRRIAVSAAFYIEQEFQETGFYAYRLFVATFGRAPSYLEFMNALSQVQKGAQAQENKEAMLKALVESEPVKQLYSTMSNGQYVDATLANTRLKLNDVERTATINALDAGTQTRENVLAQIIGTPAFVDSQYNEAFVLMQYFGYLRRDPDPQGYQFWLDTLNNRVPNNYRAMVCAFITSTEYQERFSSVITRSNKDCGGVQ